MVDPDYPSGVAKKGRLFLVDHMCVLPYGHNQGALALFRKELSPYFDKAIALVPKVLPSIAARERNFVRCLSYPYSALAETRFAPLVNRLMRKQTIKRYHVKFALRFLEKVPLVLVKNFTGIDLLLWSTERDWKRIFCRYGPTKDDTIFFPSTDYYGVRALLAYLRKRPSVRPKIHLRMIGVMENTAVRNIAARADLLNSIVHARKMGIAVVVSAETPVYAGYLGTALGCEVFYFPYPLIGAPIPMPRERPLVIASVGQGRADKGYFLLADLARATGFEKRAEMIFVVQSLPDDNPEFDPRYDRKLGAIPNLRLLPAILKDQDIAGLYRQSFVLLLPYSHTTYAMRGSAVYQEAVAFGRPVIVFSGVGFADLVDRYQNGYVCQNVSECAVAVRDCLAVSAQEWEDRLQKARQLYKADVETAIRLFLGTNP